MFTAIALIVFILGWLLCKLGFPLLGGSLNLMGVIMLTSVAAVWLWQNAI
jgi:hypothetical protein